MFPDDQDPVRRTGRVDVPRHQKPTRALESLKVRIDLIVKELARLRSENAALRKEVESLRQGALPEGEGTSVTFAESPDELKEHIRELIASIDAHLEQARATTSTES